MKDNGFYYWLNYLLFKFLVKLEKNINYVSKIKVK